MTPFLHVMLPGVAKSCVATSIASPSKRPAALEAPDPRLENASTRGKTPVSAVGAEHTPAVPWSSHVPSMKHSLGVSHDTPAHLSTHAPLSHTLVAAHCVFSNAFWNTHSPRKHVPGRLWHAGAVALAQYSTTSAVQASTMLSAMVHPTVTPSALAETVSVYSPMASTEPFTMLEMTGTGEPLYDGDRSRTSVPDVVPASAGMTSVAGQCRPRPPHVPWKHTSSVVSASPSSHDAPSSFMRMGPHLPASHTLA